MALTIWRTKINVHEKTICPECNKIITIYKLPFLRCPTCMSKIKPDLRDITSRINNRCAFYTTKGRTID